MEDPAAERLVDVVGVSWGLTTIGQGKATFTHPESQEAAAILTQARQKIESRRDAVTDAWMKSALHACGLVTSQADDTR